MLEEIYINSAAGARTAFGKLARLQVAHKAIRLKVYSANPRSIDQNALSHKWYQKIAQALGDDTELGIKCYCKLHHGIPILRADDEDYRGFYDASIKKLTYEQKLHAMKWVPVTSLMNKRQFTMYLDEVREDFAKRGVYLEVNDEA